MVKYWDRLKPLMDEKGIGKQGLADILDVSFQAVRKVEAGGSFGSTNNIKAADYFGVSSKWLATGIGDKRENKLFASAVLSGTQKRNAEGTYDPTSNVIVSTHSINLIPLLSWESIGNWGEAMDMRVAGKVETIKTAYSGSDNAFALQVKGDSMNPTFEEGCYIDIEPFETPIHGQYVIALLKGKKAVLRQYVEDGNMKYLKPLNDRYPMVSLTDDDSIIGVVKSSHRVF